LLGEKFIIDLDSARSPRKKKKKGGKKKEGKKRIGGPSPCKGPRKFRDALFRIAPHFVPIIVDIDRIATEGGGKEGRGGGWGRIREKGKFFPLSIRVS